MTQAEAKTEILAWQADGHSRKTIATYIEQQANISTATAYRWIAVANQEDAEGNNPREQAMDALLDIMRARQAEGNDEEVTKIAAVILKATK